MSWETLSFSECLPLRFGWNYDLAMYFCSWEIARNFDLEMLQEFFILCVVRIFTLRSLENYWPWDVVRFFFRKWWEFLPWFRWEFLSLRDVVKILALRSFENFWFWNVVRGFSMKFFSLTSGEKFYPEKLRILYHEMWWEFLLRDLERIFTLRCWKDFYLERWWEFSPWCVDRIFSLRCGENFYLEMWWEFLP